MIYNLLLILYIDERGAHRNGSPFQIHQSIQCRNKKSSPENQLATRE